MKETIIFKTKNIFATIEERKYGNIFCFEYKTKKVKSEYGCFIKDLRKFEEKHGSLYFLAEKSDFIISFLKNYEINIFVFYNEFSFKIPKKDFEKAMKKLDKFIE